MTDRGIIFSAPMVCALIAGRKTQTRRLATSPLRRCQPGDRLWVRERCRTYESVDSRNPHEVRYHVDGDEMRLPAGVGHWNSKPRPSIHMPRWASRLTLIVDAVRVEPLQAITEADALAEGTQEPTLRDLCPDLAQAAWSERQVYSRLWNHLHGAESWNANPDVVALTFRVVRENIGRLAA